MAGQIYLCSLAHDLEDLLQALHSAFRFRDVLFKGRAQFLRVRSLGHLGSATRILRSA